MKKIKVDLTFFYVNNLIKSVLPYFFLLIFFTTFIEAVKAFHIHAPCRIGDWLINYQGGFVRRGLIGSLIYVFSSFTGISPGWCVVAIQILLYALFFFYSYRILLKIKNLVLYAFLIFSPYIFTFQINCVKGGFRKEIIYFVFLIITIYYSNKLSKVDFKRFFKFVLLLFPFAVLNHEMLFIFLPYIIAIYVIEFSFREMKSLLPYVIPSFFAFLISLIFHGDALTSEKIFISLGKLNYLISQGPGSIKYLSCTAKDGFDSVKLLFWRYLYWYLIVIELILLAFYPLFPFIKRFKESFRDKFCVVRYLILFSLCLNVPLLFVATDWGRFIYIHSVSVLFILFKMDIFANKFEEFDKEDKIMNMMKEKNVGCFHLFSFLVYTNMWRLMHYGNPSIFLQNIYQIQVVKILYPFSKLIFSTIELLIQTIIGV